MPKRIQRKRTKGWRMPKGCVYVGRPSKWGNLYRVERSPLGRWDGDWTVWYINLACGPVWIYSSASKRDAAEYACKLYRDAALLHRAEIQAELGGKDLCDWCALDMPCHADVLLELANPKG